MLESYDAPHSLPCVAPRPLLVANGELDLRCHMPGVLPAIEAARKVRVSDCIQRFGDVSAWGRLLGARPFQSNPFAINPVLSGYSAAIYRRHQVHTRPAA